MKVIAIGAHPDDIEYGCYGTIRRHLDRGDTVHFIILSSGEKSGNKEIRIKEAYDSAKKLGVTLHQFHYPDTDIPQAHEVISSIETIINETKPERIYTHSIKDTHQDHRITAYHTLAAARFVREIFFYESPSLYLDFRPNYYIDITKYIEDKAKTLNMFVTQNSKDFMKINAIQGLSQFRGLTSMSMFAEAFEIVKILKIEDI